MIDRWIDQIIALEWEMFIRVKNVGGPAPCQGDKETFVIMRSSQFKAWNEETLKSYKEDLETALKEDWNLMAEKYARMMKYTAPEEYKNIRNALPCVSPTKEKLAFQIMEYHKIWIMELAEQYPNVTKRGRLIQPKDEDENNTSIETYLLGELLTYSENTLKFYLCHVACQKENGINMNRKILEFTAQAYGYSNLDKAEEMLQISF